MKIVVLLFCMINVYAESWSVVSRTLKIGLEANEISPIYFKLMKEKKGRVLIPLNLPASHPARKAFTKKVLHSSLHNWDLHFDELYFRGIKPPMVLLSIPAMKYYLSKIDGSVGYLPSNEVDEDYIELVRFQL